MINSEIYAKYKGQYEEEYRKRTVQSAAILEKSSNSTFTDGDYRQVPWYDPYPLIMSGGEGCYLFDVDGNKYLDLSGSWTAAVLGCTPEPVLSAINKAAKTKGLLSSAYTDATYEWGEKLCARFESIERLRFCCSGAEAVMFAIRGARAFTGKDKIIKMIGGYHGTYDPVEQELGWKGMLPGLPQSVAGDVFVTQFNDKEMIAEIVADNKDEIAAVIVEPMLGAGGMIPPENDYIHYIQELTAQNGIVFIADEVISGRLSTGGYQKVLNVKPDITVLGKTIAGGLPVGAFGGKKEIMDLFSPKLNQRPVHHGGTFIAQPLPAVAGIVALDMLNQGELDRINGLGDDLAVKLKKILNDVGINAQVTGWGSMHQLHFTPHAIHNAEDAKAQNWDVMHLYHLALQIRGLFPQKRAQYGISLPMSEGEIKIALDASKDALIELKLIIEEIAPELIK